MDWILDEVHLDGFTAPPDVGELVHWTCWPKLGIEDRIKWSDSIVFLEQAKSQNTKHYSNIN